MATKTIAFINKVVGLPWVNRACSFESLDCWGLVILYYQHVLNIELVDIHGYKSNECTIQSEALSEASKHWRKLDKPQDNAVFIAYSGGQPSHVGIVIGRHVLHAKGNEITGGQVQYNRLEAVAKTYQKLEYYEYINPLS